MLESVKSGNARPETADGFRALKARSLATRVAISIIAVAIWFWTQAFYWAYWAVVKAAGTGMGNPSVSVREDIGYLILYTILGVVLMVGARGLVWLAYGDVPARDTDARSD